MDDLDVNRDSREESSSSTESIKDRFVDERRAGRFTDMVDKEVVQRGVKKTGMDIHVKRVSLAVAVGTHTKVRCGPVNLEILFFRRTV